MAPVTRSQNKKQDVKTAGFPDIVQHGQQKPRKRTPAQAGYELKDLLTPKAADLREGQDVPPRYTIDLSRKPQERYTEVVLAFKNEIRSLPVLFDDIIRGYGLPLRSITGSARLFLRGLHSKEQTEELRGISKVSGIDMYLLVSFNVLLDLFMGCTSGGIRVHENGGTRMLHCRTLDWGMDSLRKVIVQLDFVERPGGEVIASTVGYCGFVGILTGVRRYLSVSLNFRPYHDNDESRMSNMRLYTHLLLVLLGLRPSISSILRSTLLPQSEPSGWNGEGTRLFLPALSEITRALPSMKTTAAYLIFSDGEETVVLEKDHNTAIVRSSDAFIATTNNDVELPGSTQPKVHNRASSATGMQELLEESEDRRACIEKQWERLVKRWQRHRNEGRAVTAEPCARAKDVVKWVEEWPITNESTHFSVLMDPKNGRIMHVRRWKEQPVPPDSASD